jgi:hypothetical protein
MISARQGIPFEAVLEDAPAGSALIHVQIVSTIGQVLIARTQSGIVEILPGVYSTALTVDTIGDFIVAWDIGDPDEIYTESLSVVAIDTPTAPVTEMRPTVDEVALLERTRTTGPSPANGGLGADTGPSDLTTFTSTTRPSSSEVARVVDMAYGTVIGGLNGAVPAAQYARVRFAITVYAALIIEASFFRETADQVTATLWRTMFTDAMASIQSAIDTQGGTAPAFGTLTIGTIRESPNCGVVYDAGVLDYDLVLDGIPVLPSGRDWPFGGATR